MEECLVYSTVAQAVANTMLKGFGNTSRDRLQGQENTLAEEEDDN